MAGVKNSIKKLLVAKSEKQYNRILKSKKMDYNQWVQTVEKLDETPKRFFAVKESSLIIDTAFQTYDAEGKHDDGKLAKIESLCKQIDIIDNLNSNEMKAQYLVCDQKSLPKLGSFLKNTENSIDAVIFRNYPGDFSNLAFSKIYEKFSEDKSLIMIYSDEDFISNSGQRSDPWYKPDWAPDDFLSYFYFGGFVAVKKEALLTILPSDKEYTDTLYSLLYKLLILNGQFRPRNESKPAVGHISGILFHSFDKPGYEYIKDMKLPAIIREKIKDTMISVVIPSKDHPDVLFRCIDTFLDITKVEEEVSYEIIIVDNGSSDKNKSTIENLVDDYNRNLHKEVLRYYHEVCPFNFSYMCNKGAKLARGNFLLFLNDDMEIVYPDWLMKLLYKAANPYVGAVGAKLIYPKSIHKDNIIQHAGITNLRIGPAHKLQFLSDDEDHYFGRNRYCHDMMGVTGACLLVKSDIFNKVGGFDENLAVAFNDVDLCYKIYEEGYFNVVRCDTMLYHHESLSRGNDSEDELKQQRLNREKDYLYERHQSLYGKDPFYNIYLTTDMLESEYAPRYHYEVRLDADRSKISDITDLISKAREDKCVRVGMECAMDIYKWKYGVPCKDKSSVGKEDLGYYFRGYTFVIGSNNACFEKTLFLQNTESKRFYGIEITTEYRPDIDKNLPDQVNTSLTGYTAKMALDALPGGHYRFGMYVKDKTSKLRLYNFSNWTLDI